MDAYGCMWMHMDACGCIWMHVDTYGSMTMHMDAYGCMRMHKDAYGVGLGLPQQGPGLDMHLLAGQICQIFHMASIP